MQNGRWTRRFGAAAGVICAATASRAAAEERPAPRKYTPFVDRGMSLPAPYAYGTLGLAGTTQRGQRTQIEASLGGGVGLTPRLWIDGSSGALRLAPELVFHSAQLGLNAQLLDHPVVELDGATHVTFGSEDRRAVEQIEPGLLAVVHAAHVLRVDAGLYLDVNPGSSALLGGRLPLSVGFQLTTKVHAAVTSGVSVGNFGDAAGSAAVPAGIALGWSDHLGKEQSVAVLPSINFPELWKPGGPERFRPGYFTVGVTFVIVTSR